MIRLRSRRHLHASRGFIVVPVLWILAMLALLVSAYAVFMTRSAALISLNEDGLQTEAISSAAIELVAGRLLTTSVEQRPSHGSFGMGMPAARVEVSWVSEAARVDLNMASKELLAGLFMVLGAASPAASLYADRIVAWRTPIQGGNDEESPYYRGSGLTYDPRHAPFQHIEELWLVAGIPPVLIERVLPLVTVFSGRSSVNIADAPPLVLGALPGVTPEALRAILGLRNTASPDPQALMALAVEAQGQAGVESSRAVRVTVSIRFANGRRAATEAVIMPKDDGDEPYRVLSWSAGPGVVSAKLL